MHGKRLHVGQLDHNLTGAVRIHPSGSSVSLTMLLRQDMSLAGLTRTMDRNPKLLL